MKTIISVARFEMQNHLIIFTYLNMKLSYILFSVFIPLLYCLDPIDSSDSATIPSLNTKRESVANIQEFDSLQIDQFFDTLIYFHKDELFSKDSALFDLFCTENNLSTKNNSNIRNFLEIKLLHDLLTAQGAVNGNTGNILNIPYFWHWINPNPRHSIHSLKSKKALNTIKPPAGYGKYATHADIDRTPGLFWSELFSSETLYYHELCDTFNTFGWCSEREMAYVCMMEILGHSGEIIVSGNHSWSEIESEFVKADHQKKKIKLSVDNTFNGFAWNQAIGNKTMGPTTKWYNEKASSETEKTKVKSVIVSPQVASDIEKNLIRYLHSQ
jgi:hypothetical protein